MALQKLNLSTQGAANTAPPGGVVQVQHIQYQGIVQTLSAPYITTNDTLPTTSMGTEYMTKAITPTNASNLIRVEFQMQLSGSSYVQRACFLTKDSETNAIATWNNWNSAQYISPMSGVYSMTAGTTSAITFRMWGASGPGGSQTIWFNGLTAATEDNGGTCTSHLTVWEIAV